MTAENSPPTFHQAAEQIDWGVVCSKNAASVGETLALRLESMRELAVTLHNLDPRSEGLNLHTEYAAASALAISANTMGCEALKAASRGTVHGDLKKANFYASKMQGATDESNLSVNPALDNLTDALDRVYAAMDDVDAIAYQVTISSNTIGAAGMLGAEGLASLKKYINENF